MPTLSQEVTFAPDSVSGFPHVDLMRRNEGSDIRNRFSPEVQKAYLDGKRVLIVDDSAFEGQRKRSILSGVFTGQVDYENDPNKALQTLYTSITGKTWEGTALSDPPAPYDAVVLDIHMPGLMGHQLLKRLVEKLTPAERKNVPAIVFDTSSLMHGISSKFQSQWDTFRSGNAMGRFIEENGTGDSKFILFNHKTLDGVDVLAAKLVLSQKIMEREGPQQAAEFIRTFEPETSVEFTPELVHTFCQQASGCGKAIYDAFNLIEGEPKRRITRSKWYADRNYEFETRLGRLMGAHLENTYFADEPGRTFNNLHDLMGDLYYFQTLCGLKKLESELSVPPHETAGRIATPQQSPLPVEVSEGFAAWRSSVRQASEGCAQMFDAYKQINVPYLDVPKFIKTYYGKGVGFSGEDSFEVRGDRKFMRTLVTSLVDLSLSINKSDAKRHIHVSAESGIEDLPDVIRSKLVESGASGYLKITMPLESPPEHDYCMGFLKAPERLGPDAGSYLLKQNKAGYLITPHSIELYLPIKNAGAPIVGIKPMPPPDMTMDDDVALRGSVGIWRNQGATADILLIGRHPLQASIGEGGIVYDGKHGRLLCATKDSYAEALLHLRCYNEPVQPQFGESFASDVCTDGTRFNVDLGSGRIRIHLECDPSSQEGKKAIQVLADLGVPKDIIDGPSRLTSFIHRDASGTPTHIFGTGHSVSEFDPEFRANIARMNLPKNSVETSREERPIAVPSTVGENIFGDSDDFLAWENQGTKADITVLGPSPLEADSLHKGIIYIGDKGRMICTVKGGHIVASDFVNNYAEQTGRGNTKLTASEVMRDDHYVRFNIGGSDKAKEISLDVEPNTPEFDKAVTTLTDLGFPKDKIRGPRKLEFGSRGDISRMFGY